MTTPAQPTPPRRSILDPIRDASTEVLLVALSALAGMIVVLLLTWLGLLPQTAQWSAIVAGPVLIGTAGASYLLFERVLADGVGPLVDPAKRPGVANGLMIAGAGIMVATLGSMVLGLIQELLFSSAVEEQRTIMDLVERGDPFELTLLGVSAIVLAPITEELLFRHMLFRRLLARAGPIAAWTIPAVAFALAHWNPVGLIIYVWLGSVFALAYWMSGRLWVAMLVHAGHNAFAFTMLLIAPDALP